VNEIQVGRYNGLLHKLLDMKEGAPSPTLATDVFPILVLEAERPEWEFLKGDRLMGCAFNQPATGGVNSKVRIRNPAGSGALVVVTMCTISIGQNNDVQYGFEATNSDLATTLSESILDTRFAEGGTTFPTGVGRVSRANTAGANSVNILEYGMAARVSRRDHFKVVLSEGFSFNVRSTAVNVSLTGGWEWRERHLEPSETR